MYAPRMFTTVAVAIGAAGALLLAGCGSSSTASAPSAAESVPAVSSEAPAPSAPMSSAPAEVTTGQVVAKWTCANEGGQVTCTCEGSEADCESTLAKPNTLKGSVTGVVKFFNTDKGYGFIAPEGGGADFFVHISAVQSAGLSSLAQNQKVVFDVESDMRGKLAATNIRVVSEG